MLVLAVASKTCGEFATSGRKEDKTILKRLEAIGKQILVGQKRDPELKLYEFRPDNEPAIGVAGLFIRAVKLVEQEYSKPPVTGLRLYIRDDHYLRLAMGVEILEAIGSDNVFTERFVGAWFYDDLTIDVSIFDNQLVKQGRTKKLNEILSAVAEISQSQKLKLFRSLQDELFPTSDENNSLASSSFPSSTKVSTELEFCIKKLDEVIVLGLNEPKKAIALLNTVFSEIVGRELGDPESKRIFKQRLSAIREFLPIELYFEGVKVQSIGINKGGTSSTGQIVLRFGGREPAKSPQAIPSLKARQK